MRAVASVVGVVEIEITHKRAVVEGRSVGRCLSAADKRTERAAAELIYVLSHKSRDAAKTSWDAFRADPDWLAVKAESEKDGPIVAKLESVYMTRTDYSPAGGS